MIIAMGHKIIDGPWGGGNSFAKSFVDYFSCRDGFVVVDSLCRNDIDVIIITDPRWWSPSVSFSLRKILYYKTFIKRDVIVIHRINECDERKGTRFMNLLLRMANSLADHTVFISDWLKSLNTYCVSLDHSSVILNGGKRSLFKNSATSRLSEKKELRLVTHHWALHENKGLSIYRFIDKLHGKFLNGLRINFTYIGSPKASIYLPNSEIIGPFTGEELSDELARKDIYVTASQNEPAGMHHIEGCLAGLPVLYRKGGGGIREYCNGYGLEFTNTQDFINQLSALVKDYDSFKNRLDSYPFDSDRMNGEYLKLILKLTKTKNLKNIENRLHILKRISYHCLIIFAPR